jgi:hypothetical protein
MKMNDDLLERYDQAVTNTDAAEGALMNLALIEEAIISRKVIEMLREQIAEAKIPTHDEWRDPLDAPMGVPLRVQTIFGEEKVWRRGFGKYPDIWTDGGSLFGGCVLGWKPMSSEVNK